VFIGKVKIFSFSETQCFLVNNGNLGACEADYFCFDDSGVIKKCCSLHRAADTPDRKIVLTQQWINIHQGKFD
jgi:hypothetical protein